MKKACAPALWTLLGLMSLPAMAQSTGEPADAAVAAAPQDAQGEGSVDAAPAENPPAGAEAAPAASETAETVAVPTTDKPAEKAEAAPADNAAPGSVKLDDVVVTVTKRAQASRDIPSSMTVLGGEKLEKLGIRKLKDLFTLVPGLNMQDEIAGLQRKVSIRGAGPDTGTNQTVGSVMGDIPISDPFGSFTIVDPNPWDMKTVEALKGPQGTLFGATSLAGLIRYVPNTPELQRWEGKFFTDYTSVDRGGMAPAYGGALNMPVGDDVAVRVSGIYQNLPGLLDSDNPARQAQDTDKAVSWNGRAMALWQPLERLTVNAWYMKERRAADDLNFISKRDGSYTRKDAPTASPNSSDFSLGTLDVRYAFDWATLVSLTGYQRKARHIEIDTNYIAEPVALAGLNLLRGVTDVATHGLLQELRLVSADSGALTWVGGVYYSTYKGETQNRLFVPNTQLLGQLGSLGLPASLLPIITDVGVTGTNNGLDPIDANEQAVYGEANYDFTDEWRLTLGSRLYQTTVKGTNRGSGASAGKNGKVLGGTEKGWSPKAALTWKPWTDIMFYASASRGFQFGGFNTVNIPQPSIPETFKSSTLWNYEIGTRTDWFDRTLRLDVTGFFIDWTNPQVKQPAPPPDLIDLYVTNVGGSHNVGVEATIRWITPLQGVTIEQTGSYIEARTSKPFVDSTGTTIPVGTLMPSAPEVQAVTTLTYSAPFGGWMTQTSLINSLQGKAWADIGHHLSVGDYDLLNFNFSISRNDLSFAPTFSLGINNLTNVQTLAAGFAPEPGSATAAAQFLVSAASYVYTQPRSIVLRTSLEF